MPATIIIGAQWGDEGKGRAVDWLASDADIVARYSGGDNAGHTLYVNSEVFKLHLIPSGILHPQAVCVLGNGMVVNPVNMVKEIDQLSAMGIDVTPERLMLSTRAHIITPAHITLDSVQEKARGDQKLGTTLRGIGPAYLDKIGRKGIRAGKMSDLENYLEALTQAIEQTNEQLRRDGLPLIDLDAHLQPYLEAAERLRPFLADTTVFLNEQLRSNAQVVCEGAQGTLLDVDHGSYPFVTSSSPSVGGALSGLGFGPKYVDRVIGVAKAFSTRVGSGAMPTELEGALAQRLRGTGENFWDEFGTTTGRPRRCGWLDAVILRYACAVNGFTELIITKLDILSGFEELKIAIAYQIHGERSDYPPSTMEELQHAQPIYETLPGWSEDVSGIRRMEDLPKNARAYVERIAELCDTPIYTVSVGPERDQLVHA
ncbi:MAG: adenylosuccinate synthase [Anaerolineae bacterium]|jgi:adenylosuccinate synthase|nr:adenylosuccinate synthase [Anaerolineae bacterium]